MRVPILLAALAVSLSVALPNSAEAQTLDSVKARGTLKCIINTGLPGFAFTDASNRWIGFDVDFCRAQAAAILGDGDAVEFVNATARNRFTLLTSGEGDVLWRNTTITMSRDTDLKVSFVGVNYYDGAGFLVPKSLGLTSALELDGTSVCVQTGTTTELSLSDFFRTNGMQYETVPIETEDEARVSYQAGRCDAYTTDASALATTRAVLADPDAHTILPELFSKEPLGPAVAHGDDNWADVVRWVLNVLIEAEEYGITQANVDEMARGSDNPAINRILGTEGSFGEYLGLDADWAVNMIRAVGNYGEIFDRNIGPDTPIGLERGLNAQWYDGGVLYAYPVR